MAGVNHALKIAHGMEIELPLLQAAESAVIPALVAPGDELFQAQAGEPGGLDPVKRRGIAADGENCNSSGGHIFLPQHRHFYAVPFGSCNGLLITGIRMTDHAQARVGGEDALQPPGGSRCAIGDDDLAGVLAVTDADPAAVMERDPGGAADGVDHGVENCPV